MCVKDVTIQNQVGLHARPATFFIQKANEFKSSIWVEKDERRVNAKSLLGVLSLGIIGGTTVKIYADGADINGMIEEYNKGIVKGFTTNPTLMKKAGVKDYVTFAKEVISEIPDLPLSFFRTISEPGVGVNSPYICSADTP